MIPVNKEDQIMKRFERAFRLAALVLCVPVIILFLNCEPKSEPEPSKTDQSTSETPIPDTEKGEAEPDTMKIIEEEGGGQAEPSGGGEGSEGGEGDPE
jgi:hypothetical protein